jgi:hypothetical protein
MDSAAEALRDTSTLSFRNVVSSCFEDHLGGYVDMEERQMVEELERLLLAETWGATNGGLGERESSESSQLSDKKSVGFQNTLKSSIAARLGTAEKLPGGSKPGSAGDLAGLGGGAHSVAAVAGASDGSGEVLGSAGAVFLNIKKVFKRCSNLTKGKPLLALHGAFSRVLRAYAAALRQNAEDAGSFLRDVSKHSNKTRDVSHRVADAVVKLCLIVNTAEWCQETVGPLGESMRRALNSDALKQQVTRDVDATEEAFASLAGRRVCVFGVGRRGAHGAGAKNHGDALGRVGDGRRPERARRRVRFRVDERGRHGAARVAQEHVRVFLRETGGGGCGFDVRRDFEIASRRRVWRAAAPAGRAVGENFASGAAFSGRRFVLLGDGERRVSSRGRTRG